MFVACAVTRSRYKKDQEDIDLSDSFLSGNDVPETVGDVDTCDSPKLEELTLSRGQLIESQGRDSSLSQLFEGAVAMEAASSMSTGFCLKDAMLMRKFIRVHLPLTSSVLPCKLSYPALFEQRF